MTNKLYDKTKINLKVTTFSHRCI